MLGGRSPAGSVTSSAPEGCSQARGPAEPRREVKPALEDAVGGSHLQPLRQCLGVRLRLQGQLGWSLNLGLDAHSEQPYRGH